MQRIVTFLECLGMLACAALLLRGFLGLGYSTGWPGLLCCAAALPIGYYCADLLSGLIHWVCDSFGNAQTPVWGPMLVAPFRRHHRSPADITRIGLAENLGSSAIAGAVVLYWWSPQTRANVAWLDIVAVNCGLWCVAFAVLSNRFHRWAHLPTARRPRWMQQLQARHIILSPQVHALHHRKPHRGNYCILSGWANPLCNSVPWEHIEHGLSRLGIRTNFD